MEVKRWYGGILTMGAVPQLFPDEYTHNSLNNWASDCCGIRRDNAVNPIVSPADSWLGVRVYLDGFIGEAGPQNKVLNLNTKAGPIGVVLTQTVLSRYTTESSVDPCCVDEDSYDEDFDEENE